MTPSFWRVTRSDMLDFPIGSIVELTQTADVWRVRRPRIGLEHVFAKTITTATQTGESLVLENAGLGRLELTAATEDERNGLETLGDRVVALALSAVPPFGATPTGGPFDAASLTTNRLGMLAERQVREAQSLVTRAQFNVVLGTGLATLTAVGVLLLRSTLEMAQAVAPSADPSQESQLALLVALAVFLASGAVLIPLRRFLRARTDLISNRVNIAEGAVHKTWSSLGRGSGTHYYLLLSPAAPGAASGLQQFETSRELYAAVPKSGRIRLFVLPLTHRVVNFEPLPGTPPTGAPEA